MPTANNKHSKINTATWPKLSWEAVQWLLDRENRPREVKFGNVPIPTWESEDNKEVIVLPRVRPGSGGAGTQSYPWEISVSDGSAYVRPGSVNSLVPSNIFDSFDLSEDSTYWVKINCSTDGKSVNSIELEVDGSAVDSSDSVAENAAPSTFWDTIGIIVTGDADMDGAFTSAIYQIRSTNLAATPAIAFLESRTAPSILDEPFLRWYQWSLTSQ